MSWNDDDGAGDFMGCVPDDDPGPEMQLPTLGQTIAIVVILAAIVVGASSFGADVKQFGAVGDGVIDDTVAIQAAGSSA